MRLCSDSLISSLVYENSEDGFYTPICKDRNRHGVAEYTTDKLAFY